MPPKGWRKNRDMSQSPQPAWREDFKPWGDRLDFLTPEEQHLFTGKLVILPAETKPEREVN